MIKSMTGFGRSEFADESRKISVELKSVNHRYLEAGIKMPKKLNIFDAALRAELKKYAQRGKIDIYITYEDLTENQVCLKYNEELAAEYMEVFSKMEKRFGLENDIRVSTLARFPEVLAMEEQSMEEDEIWKELVTVFDAACEKFVAARIAEGEQLRTDLLAKLDYLSELVAFVEVRSPQILVEYRAKLEDKVRELLADSQMDDGRIAAEVTIFADKICVDEETVRLKSHIAAMKSVLEKGEGSIGRKLDFIAQEMNREANTILSKANDLEVTNHAIELKTEIEKVREQIQNVE